MNDRPSASELIAVARQFLEGELLPNLTDPRLRFQTLVAAHVLGIAEREYATEETHLRSEWAWLRRLLEVETREVASGEELRRAVRQGNNRLCEQIRSGRYDEPAVFRHLAGELRRVVQLKLQVANPRYLKGLAPGS